MLMRSIFPGDTEHDLTARILKARKVLGEFLLAEYLKSTNSEFEYYIYFWLIDLIQHTYAWQSSLENVELIDTYLNLISFTGQHEKVALLILRLVEMQQELLEKNDEKITLAKVRLANTFIILGNLIELRRC